MQLNFNRNVTFAKIIFDRVNMIDLKPVSLQDFQQLIENEQALLIYFYNDNCAPCLSLRPKVIELVKEKFPKLKMVLSNSLSQPEVSAYYSAFNNPTLIIFFEGKEYRRESKYISIPQLAQTIERPYNMLFS